MNEQKRTSWCLLIILWDTRKKCISQVGTPAECFVSVFYSKKNHGPIYIKYIMQKEVSVLCFRGLFGHASANVEDILCIHIEICVRSI